MVNFIKFIFCTFQIVSICSCMTYKSDSISPSNNEKKKSTLKSPYPNGMFKNELLIEGKYKDRELRDGLYDALFNANSG